MTPPPHTDLSLASNQIAWTLEQLLERLPVSRSTVYRWIEQEDLPVIRVAESSKPLFLPQSVIAWLESREQQKATDAERRAATAVAFDASRLAELRQTARRTRSRRTPPPPIAAAGSRDRLRRIRGAH